MSSIKQIQRLQHLVNKQKIGEIQEIKDLLTLVNDELEVIKSRMVELNKYQGRGNW